MHINSILLECVDEFQFINNTTKAVFSAKIAKGRQKLGLLRLIIPKYCNKINKIFEEQENTFSGTSSLEIGSLFSQLSF